jgi:acyl-CoA hydrolase
MEVMVEAYSENYLSGEIKLTNKAYLTLVALNEKGKPHPVPSLILETDEERNEYNEAIKRREARLLRRESLLTTKS